MPRRSAPQAVFGIVSLGNLTETGSQRGLSNASLWSGVVNETTSSEAVKTCLLYTSDAADEL